MPSWIRPGSSASTSSTPTSLYGQSGHGITEQIIGHRFAHGGGRREFVVLATKVFGQMDAEARPDPNLGRGLSARKIIRCCDASPTLPRLVRKGSDIVVSRKAIADVVFE